MNALKITFFIFCYTVLFSVVCCSPKKYEPEERDFIPSHRYYESNLPNSHNYNNNNYNRYNSSTTSSTNQNRQTTAESKTDKKESRFGIVYGTSGNGGTYGNGNGVGYAPMKLDIGGIALGALIGLGAILIVPKIAHILSGGHGYRSLDGEMSSITEILSRIDNSLEQHNIDSSSCMQRIICTYVNDATKNDKNGETGALDEFILGFTNNTLFSYLLDGTAIKQSVEIGKTTEDAEKCSSLYPKCPLSKENVLKVISTLLPAR